jgi:hypothetical protein
MTLSMAGEAGRYPGSYRRAWRWTILTSQLAGRHARSLHSGAMDPLTRACNIGSRFRNCTRFEEAKTPGSDPLAVADSPVRI